MLSADDHDSARASVNNSHYTDPLVIHWIWAALRRLGFQGGNILEPSAGPGHFLGCMPADIAQRSRVTAIELDRISGRILRSLYGACGVDVRIGGFEAATLAEGTYDLILSNPPYVKAASMRRLPEEYRREPEMALASGSDGLEHTRAILAQARRHLLPGGLLVVEIGHNRKTQDLFQQWSSVQIRPLALQHRPSISEDESHRLSAFS